MEKCDKFYFSKPIFGWGAGTFPNVFFNDGYFLIPFANIQPQHAHNIFLEIAYNFGLPLALILSGFFLKIIIKAFNFIDNYTYSEANNYLNKVWLASAVAVILLSHLSDMTYYDGKISIIFAALLAGLKNIALQEDKYVNHLKMTPNSKYEYSVTGANGFIGKNLVSFLRKNTSYLFTNFPEKTF